MFKIDFSNRKIKLITKNPLQTRDSLSSNSTVEQDNNYSLVEINSDPSLVKEKNYNIDKKFKISKINYGYMFPRRGNKGSIRLPKINLRTSTKRVHSEVRIFENSKKISHIDFLEERLQILSRNNLSMGEKSQCLSQNNLGAEERLQNLSRNNLSMEEATAKPAHKYTFINSPLFKPAPIRRVRYLDTSKIGDKYRNCITPVDL